jgi:transglutaminase-like putative cysteine protease
MKPGDALLDTMFDPMSGQTVTETIRCIEIPAAGNGGIWVLSNSNNLVGREETWKLDTGGSTLYLEIFPFVAKKKDNKIKTGKTASLFSMLDALSIPSRRVSRDNERISLQLDTALAPDSSVLRFYERHGSSWILRPVSSVCRKTDTAGEINESLRNFTLSTSTMQSGDPRIVNLADSLVRGLPDRCDSIRACYRYVADKLEKRYTPTFSNALETLRAGYGDCGEHAVLLGALLRALRIPARVVLGLAYWKEKNGYYYHAWVMAWSHGAWVFVDPALGVFPAFRDRIPLVIDDSGRDVVRIAKLIGRIDVKYIKK